MTCAACRTPGPIVAVVEGAPLCATCERARRELETMEAVSPATERSRQWIRQ